MVKIEEVLPVFQNFNSEILKCYRLKSFFDIKEAKGRNIK